MSREFYKGNLFPSLIFRLSPIRNASARASTMTFDSRFVHTERVAFYFTSSIEVRGSPGSYSEVKMLSGVDGPEV